MGYKVTFGSGHSVVFDNEPTQADIEEAEASLGLTQKKPKATWGETVKGAGSELLNMVGTGLSRAAVGAEVVRGASPINQLLAGLGVEAAKPNQELIDKIISFDKGAQLEDPTQGKQLSGPQRGVKAGIQLAGALTGGPASIAGMMAGGTGVETDRMLEEGMPLEKAQQFAAADAALNTASFAVGGLGKRALTQGVTAGLGNMAGDEASHLLANAFRESEGLRQNERDNVDRAISFGFGFGPGYIAKRAENATQVDQVKNVEADAKAKIEEFLATKEAQDPLNKPSTLELLPKESYPEPLGNRSIDPDTKTVTTGMAEDVPTIDFPLRPEAMERDRKFQRLQKDLLAERQILDDYKERGLGPEDIKQQETAVESARQSFAKYLNEGYGIKEAGDAYRGLYESGKETSLKVERGFDPKSLAAQKKELGLVDYYKGNSTEFVGRVKELVDAGDYNGALDYIAKTQPQTIEGKVARTLRRLNDTDLFLSKDPSFGSGDNLSKSRYSLQDHEIVMSPWQSGNYRTFLHEAVHSATSVAMYRQEIGQTKGMSVNEINATKRVSDLYSQVKSLSKYPDLYGFKNAREFIAEALSSKSFQDELRSIKINEGAFKNAWQKVVDVVRQMMGLDKKYATALDRALDAGNKLIKESSAETRMSGVNTFKAKVSEDFSGGNKLDRYTKFEDFKNDLPPELKEHAAKYWAEAGRELPAPEQTALRNQAEAKVVEKLLKGDDRVKYLTQDTRSADEIKGVLESYKDKDGKYKDISDNAFRNELSSGGYALSNLTQHPLVHWVTSKTMRALKEAEIKSETAISEKGRGFLAILKAGSADQIRDLSAKLLAAEGKDVDVTKAFEFNGWEKRVLESWNRAKDQALNDFNQMRQAKGLEPVEPRLNYLASMFTGNFRMLVKKDGKTVGWINGNSKAELQDAMRHFEGQGYEFGNPSRIPYARSKDFQKMLARRMAAFDEVINIFGKSDPEVAEFSSRMENLISKQAYDYLDFKQHFKEKSGVFGAEGMKKWKDAHANAYDLWNAQAEYIRMVNQWVAQQKVEPDVKQVLVDSDIRDKMPNAAKLSENIYNNAFGRLESIQVLEKFADAYVAAVNSDFVNAVPGGKQLQKVNPFEAMRSIKNWALYSALALNPGFMVSQVVQVPAATSTMMQYFADLGIQGNKGQSLSFGLWDTANHSPKMRMLAQIAAKNLGESLPDGFISDVGQYFNKYAEENHIINPHILEKTDLYSKNPALRTIQKADEKLGGTISRPEEMTRRWAFNTLAHYLYSAGFPKEKAAEMAEVATSISMVDYSRQSRPMIYNRLGMLGDMASTVTTFKHNAYTQLATYGVNKAPKTVLTMMGIQLLLGGLVGMYALDDADDVWSVAKSLFPETLKDTPGIKEMIMRNADEFWAFGGLAAGSRFIMPEGIDIGTKFSMDNLFPDSAAEAMFPLLSALVQTGEGVGKFALAPTKANAAGIVYPMMPAPIKGVMESTVFSDEKGGYIPSKTDQLKTKRSFNEQMLRSTTGMRSLDERKESEIVFRTKNSRLRDEQLQQRYLDQAKTYSRDGDKKKTAQAIVKYMSNGGEWRNVNSFLERTYRGFVLDEIQRLSPKTLKTIRQQQQQLDLMEFQKDMEN